MMKAVRASALLLLLVGTVSAGEILTPPAPPQPLDAAQAQSATSNTVATDAMIETILDLVLNALP